ncbi:MAG: hypothetical protein ACRC7J_05275, partial [Vibrio ordalii]
MFNQKNTPVSVADKNYYRALGLTILFSGLLLNPISQAIAAEFRADAVAESEGQWWSTYTLAIKNTGSESADMRDAVI